MNFSPTRAVDFPFSALLFHLFFSCIIWYMRYSFEKNKILEKQTKKRLKFFEWFFASREKFLEISM